MPFLNSAMVRIRAADDCIVGVGFLMGEWQAFFNLVGQVHFSQLSQLEAIQVG
jgi:hypothetical protein